MLDALWKVKIHCLRMAQPFGRKNILENLKAIFFVSHCELRAKTATWLSAYVVDSDDYVNLYANCYSRRAELRFRSFCHSVCIITVLLLIYDAVHNAMTSQECSKNPYCMVVSHACIHAPLVRSQAKPKMSAVWLALWQHAIWQANPRFAGCIIRITEVIARYYVIIKTPTTVQS